MLFWPRSSSLPTVSAFKSPDICVSTSWVLLPGHSRLGGRECPCVSKWQQSLDEELVLPSWDVDICGAKVGVQKCWLDGRGEVRGRWGCGALESEADTLGPLVLLFAPGPCCIAQFPAAFYGAKPGHLFLKQTVQLWTFIDYLQPKPQRLGCPSCNSKYYEGKLCYF